MATAAGPSAASVPPSEAGPSRPTSTIAPLRVAVRVRPPRQGEASHLECEERIGTQLHVQLLILLSLACDGELSAFVAAL